MVKTKKIKLALVHDYLNEAGGAERVLRVISEMYPGAPIYTAFCKPGTATEFLAGRRIVESPWAKLLKIGRFYSYFRFLLPWVWKSIDLTDYDLVITSCSGYIARGFRVRRDARVVAYCHTPPRWLYGYDTPTAASSKWWGRAFMWVVGPPLRYFDYISAQRVDTWIANSKEVALRIAKFYRKEAAVVYPPIELKSKNKGSKIKKNDYYLLVTRVTGAKGVSQAVAAAKQGHFKLKLVGEVIERRLLEQIGHNERYVEYLGRVSDAELVQLYACAKGFIALARDEDFGMTVVEAMSYGTPVLAFNGGGYKETVVPGKSGILIDETDISRVAKGIKAMETTKWDRAKIKKWAARFGRERFEREFYARITRG